MERQELFNEIDSEINKYFENKTHFFNFLGDNQNLKEIFIAAVTKFIVMFLLHSVASPMNKNDLAELVRSTMEEVTLHVKNIISSAGILMLKEEK